MLNNQLIKKFSWLQTIFTIVSKLNGSIGTICVLVIFFGLDFVKFTTVTLIAIWLSSNLIYFYLGQCYEKSLKFNIDPNIIATFQTKLTEAFTNSDNQEILFIMYNMVNAGVSEDYLQKLLQSGVGKEHSFLLQHYKNTDEKSGYKIVLLNRNSEIASLVLS